MRSQSIQTSNVLLDAFVYTGCTHEVLTKDNLCLADMDPKALAKHDIVFVSLGTLEREFSIAQERKTYSNRRPPAYCYYPPSIFGVNFRISWWYEEFLKNRYVLIIIFILSHPFIKRMRHSDWRAKRFHGLCQWPHDCLQDIESV